MDKEDQSHMTGIFSISRDIISVSPEGAIRRADTLAAEEPLEIQLSYNRSGIVTSTSISVTMRTPGHDDYLAMGFLFTEGIINKIQDIVTVDRPTTDCNRRTDNIIVVSLHHHIPVDLDKLKRHFYTSSSCGVCGKASIEAIYSYKKGILDSSFTINADLLRMLPRRLKERQEVFKSTGGLHASALVNLHGDILLLHEDVGRHNALDKLIGQALSEPIEMSRSLLLLSGRASFELIQKAAMAGINFVAAIGAPSSLAVQLADSSGITLIGFLNESRFNIYTGAQRVSMI